MKLFIKPHNETAWEFYRNHGHFHDGDAGLDLYILEDQTFASSETKLRTYSICLVGTRITIPNSSLKRASKV